MGRKRKERSESSQTLVNREARDDDDDVDDETVQEEAEGGGGGGGFFACYLLTSLSPRFKGRTYIGFTVNPRRRIRQHNGEIGCGAWRTKSKRPWEMVLCIYGFPTNVAALQFEWAWQHPFESLAVRKAAAAFKSLSGIGNKIKLAYTMLTLPSWQSLNLTVNFFSTKYTKHSAGSPSLPEQMKVQIRSMNELPCYTGGDQNLYGNDEWGDVEEGNIKDGSANAAVRNSEDLQNREFEETSGAFGLVKEKSAVDATVDSSADHRNRVEDYIPEWSISMEEHVPRWAREGGDNRQPVKGKLVSDATVDSSDHRNRIEDHIPEWIRNIEEEFPVWSRDLPIQRDDIRQPFWLDNSNPGEFCSSPTSSECNTKADWSTAAARRDQHPVDPSEVEVIDLFTPSSPTNKTSSRKKRGFSTGCPQIIDLTKSPIYV